jgi:peptidoglycan/LPS O-acetylase OafA/YrhL
VSPSATSAGAATAQAPAVPPAERGEAISQAGERRSARVESLRALAALAVLWSHVLGFTLALHPALPTAADLSVPERALYGGGFGVFFFFALSGYLLFWPFAKRDYGGGDTIDLGRYAINRALRILPLYYAVVIVVLIFNEQGSLLGVWARFATLTENFFPYTAGEVIGPAWSLVVELHFYLLLPVLALAVARLARGAAARAAAVLLALGVVSLLLRIDRVLLADQVDPLWRFNIPATFLFFVPGMLLALVRLSWEQRRPSWLRGPLERADLWILASLPFWALVVFYRYDLDPALCVASFLMIGACVLPLRPGPLVNALEWRPLAILGIASYSLYLWHVPVLEVVVDVLETPGFLELAVVGVPAAIAVALVSFRAIEAPFLRLRRQWARSSARQERPTAAPAPAAGGGTA